MPFNASVRFTSCCEKSDFNLAVVYAGPQSQRSRANSLNNPALIQLLKGNPGKCGLVMVPSPTEQELEFYRKQAADAMKQAMATADLAERAGLLNLAMAWHRLITQTKNATAPSLDVDAEPKARPDFWTSKILLLRRP